MNPRLCALLLVLTATSQAETRPVEFEHLPQRVKQLWGYEISRNSSSLRVIVPAKSAPLTSRALFRIRDSSGQTASLVEVKAGPAKDGSIEFEVGVVGAFGAELTILTRIPKGGEEFERSLKHGFGGLSFILLPQT
jgi:hypothetical protein